MKKIIIYISTLLPMLCALSCSDFLDKEFDLSMAEDQVFSNKDNTRGFLANIYASLPDGFNGYSDEQFLGASRDCMTDNAISFWDVHYYNSVLTDGYSALNHPFMNFWNRNVYGIRKTNQFMKNAQEAVIGNTAMPGDDNRLYDRNMAEAKLLRAIFHFDIIAWFGACPVIGEDDEGVPMIFDLSAPEQMNMTRTPAPDALKWVAEQCDQVKDLLPFRYSNETENWGRVNGATAYALKARALLYRASKLNNSSGEASLWQEAAQAALDFISKNTQQSNPYRLYTDASNNTQNNYYACFTTNPVYNNEFILCRSVWNTNAIERLLAPCGWSGTINSVGRTNPTQNLVDCYETINGLPIYEDPTYDNQNPYANRDPRLDQTILHQGSVWGDRQQEEEREVDVSSPDGQDYQELHGGTLTGYYTKKFLHNISFVSPSIPTHAWPVFRYAEVLLNAAEAINEAEGPANAYTYVNQVRARVGMPPLAGLTKEQLRDRIRNERRIELCFEDHRFFDARRWMLYTDQTSASETGKPYSLQYYHIYGVTVTNPANPAYVYGPAEKRQELVFNSPKNYYLPLPDTEVKRAPNLKQNTGWELSASGGND